MPRSSSRQLQIELRNAVGSALEVFVAGEIAEDAFDVAARLLELRRGARHVSIDTGGQTQSEVVGLEAAVKDSTRYASTGGWAYFGLIC